MCQSSDNPGLLNLNLRFDGAHHLSSSKRIHLVAGPTKAVETSYTNTRLVLSDYLADILVDRRFVPPIYHWVVQRIGSADVVKWGQEATFEEAESAARDCIERRAATAEKRQAH